jgi:hypothetical protein
VGISERRVRGAEGEASTSAGEPIRDGEIYTLAQFMRRAGIGRHAYRAMRQRGLRTTSVGNRVFVTGADFARFLKSLPAQPREAMPASGSAEQQAAQMAADIRRLGERLLAAAERFLGPAAPDPR